MDEEDGDEPGESFKSYLNAIEASANAYGYLVRATSDICEARYHYYCDDGDAKVPEELVVVANTRKVPIKDSEFFRIGSTKGAIEAEQVPGKNPGATHFVPAKGKAAASAMTQWKADFRADINTIHKVEPRAQYVCMPELGFPYGLDYVDELVIPPGIDNDWDWLQDSEFLTSRFVCLGSAHRTFLHSEASEHFQYENVAVVYPSGKTPSASPKQVFKAKHSQVEKVAKVEGVTFTTQVKAGIAAHFNPAGVTAIRRSDLSSPDIAGIDPGEVRHAKKAFDFYDSTADSSAAPIYIKKKSPARKLGEYIDASGKIELDIFVTDMGVIAVLICYDAFDPSIFLSAVRMYYQCLDRKGDYRHQAIDIFFIPAFNRSQKFVDMCKVLSRETNSMVVYVSGDDRCEVKSDVFICGHSGQALADAMSPEATPKFYYERKSVPGHEHLHVHKINREVLYAASRQLRIHASENTRKAMILYPKRLGPDVLL